MLTVEELRGNNTTQAQMKVISMLKPLQILLEPERQSCKLSL